MTLPNSIYDPEKGHELYNRYFDEIERADKLGWDSVIVNEHHQNAYGTMPSPNIMAAVLTQRVKRAKIGIVGNALPLHDDPLRVAEEIAMLWVLGFVEGIILVATPAMVRDFSPRLGRATAMAFWTIGPVGGSLLATTVASTTIGMFGNWQSQYIIAGIVGLIVAIVCFFNMRDLSPALRAQIMISLQEKALLEARAQGIDVDNALKHPWRQMLRPRIILSALGVSFFLMLYYATVSYFPTYFNAIFHYSLPLANGLLGIYWAVDILSSIVGGILSDKFEVRKPFMLIGTLGNLIATLIFISRVGQPTSPVFMGILLGLSGLFGPVAYVGWMAGYTETVEDVNPALVATGIAVWGSLIRLFVVVYTIAFGMVVVNILDGGQWAIWWWACVGSMLAFIPTIFLASGYWNPVRARSTNEAKLRAEGLSLESSAEPA
ncbi:MAG TPA: MFS transporter [Ktedonobacteraceae bacterium]|nr:MFS transporter [Ktedonobacteraceae bacterium]